MYVEGDDGDAGIGAPVAAANMEGRPGCESTDFEDALDGDGELALAGYGPIALTGSYLRARSSRLVGDASNASGPLPMLALLVLLGSVGSLGRCRRERGSAEGLSDV